MKIFTSCAAFVMLLSCSAATMAQRIKLESGDLSPLKGETSINIQFTYLNMGVGKYANEAGYIEKKKTDYNSKEAGRGDAWAKQWVTDRSMSFEPKFLDLFTKYSFISDNRKAKYTMIFNTNFTEPGFVGYGPIRENAKINGEATIVETADPSKIIAVISVEKSPGRSFTGFDYDTGTRLTEAYAAAGKALGKFIKNK